MLCHDCPQLDASRMPESWRPAATCCLERQKDHRLAFRTPASKEDRANMTRQQRRHAERMDRKGRRRG
jgi:hypothetical protein